MEIRASAKIKIIATNEIVRTLKIYGKGLQFCINQAWKRKIKNNIKLHPFVYLSLRKRGLQSQLAVACIKQACGMVKKAKTKPVVDRVSMRYNFPRSASSKNNVLSLATVKGRVKIPFDIPKCYVKYFDWKVCESLLRIDKKGRCFFLFTFSKEVDTKVSDFQSRVLGIDLGVNKLAVTSDGKFFGKEFKQLRVKRDRLVSKLQAKGTKSAKRKLKSFGHRWTRFMAWQNHIISKRIVESVRSGDVIVMEDLRFIRRTAKYNKWNHKWSFRQLQDFIEYKAMAKGCRIVYVNPRYTSKSCNRCHSLNTSRHNGFFECRSCGHSLDSDLNGSRNIAQRYKRNMCLAGVTQPLISNDDVKASASA